MQTPNTAIQSTGPAPEAVLSTAERMSVWGAWYFRQGVLSVLTAPLFLILAYCVAMAVGSAIIQELALIRAAHVAFGGLGSLAAVIFGWFPVALAPIIFFSLLKAFPTLWLRPDATLRQRLVYSALVLTFLPLLAYAVHDGLALLIGWLADRDPCAALQIGITGSRVPLNCP